MPWGVSLALGLWLASCHEVGLGAPCVMVALATIFLELRGWMAFMPIAMFGWICGTFLLAMKADDRHARNQSTTIECIDRRRLVVRCLGLAACMVTIGFATLRVQQPSSMVMLALRNKEPTYLLHDGRMATGWHTRPRDSALVIAAAKNLCLHLSDQHCLRKGPFTKKVHPPFEAWTHSWISWSPSDTVTSTSKSISSISTSW